MKTVQDIITILKETSVTRIPVLTCSMCNYPCGYIINSLEPVNISYDSGCDCIRGPSTIEPRDIESIADWYNMQNNDKARAGIMEAMGIVENNEQRHT